MKIKKEDGIPSARQKYTHIRIYRCILFQPLFKAKSATQEIDFIAGS